MTEIKVVGVTYEGREEAIKHVIDSNSHKDIGHSLKGVARLKKDPSNQYDPNAIKILFQDGKGKWFHAGYVPREQTKDVALLMKNIKRFDLKETLEGYVIQPTDIAKYAANNPFVKPGDGSTKIKITNRIGCGLMVFILLMIIIIIFT